VAMRTVLPREVEQIDRAGAAFDSLTDLKPVEVQPSAPAVPYSTDVPYEHVLCVSAPSELTYDLAGAYRSLICTLAVPDYLLPLARVRFVILADDSEVFRSAAMSSIDDPVT